MEHSNAHNAGPSAMNDTTEHNALGHHAFLRALTSQQREAMTAKSNLIGLRHLTLYVMCLFGCAGYIIAQGPFYPLMMVPLGILVAFLFTLQHECTHNTPFRSAWLNSLVGQITGLILCQPFIWFRHFHMAHHRHTNILGKDPELGDIPKPESWLSLMIHLSTVTYWRDKMIVLFGNAFSAKAAPYIPKGAQASVRREARAMVVCYGLMIVMIMNGQFWLFSLWLIPVMIGFPFLRLYLLAEHGKCPHVANMFENTRTVYTNKLICFVTWNMPYHTEHHILPSVPFYQLPALNDLTKENLTQTNQGYHDFTASYVKGLKSKTQS